MRRLILILVGMLTLAGCGGGGKHAPYRTLPRPPLGQQVAPPTCAKIPVKQHVMGLCLPHPREAAQRAPAQTGITGPDLSNNDPVNDSQMAAIAQRSRFVYLKSIEGTGFYDSTAQRMSASAGAHGLPAGGYDFLHVCGNNATAEADDFVRALYAQHLLGAGKLPPSADAEYGSGSCGGRAWMNDWVGEVYAKDGHVCPALYTGAWWWNPNMGSFWPFCGGRGLISWISGYGVSYPYMPAGWGTLDLWQLYDNGFNGATYADLSVWRDGEAAFQAFAHVSPPAPPNPYLIFTNVVYDLGHGIRAAERPIVQGWNDRHCLHPTIRNVCGFLNYRLRLLDGRLKAVADRSRPADWSTGHRFKRARYIERELAQKRAPWSLPQ